VVEIGDVRLLMERLTLMYGQPPVPVESRQAYAAEWRRALEGTAPDILQEATDRLIRTRRYRTWPTIGDVIHAIGQVGAERALASQKMAEAEQQRLENLPKPALSPEQITEAQRLMAERAERLAKAGIRDGVVGGISAEQWAAGSAARWYDDAERKARARRLAAMSPEQRREEQRWRKEARRALSRTVKRQRRRPLH
jgi:hypothetical protein